MGGLLIYVCPADFYLCENQAAKTIVLFYLVLEVYFYVQPCQGVNSQILVPCPSTVVSI